MSTRSPFFGVLHGHGIGQQKPKNPLEAHGDRPVNLGRPFEIHFKGFHPLDRR